MLPENSSFVVKKSQNAKYKQFEIPIDISVAIASFYLEYDLLHNLGYAKLFEEISFIFKLSLLSNSILQIFEETFLKGYCQMPNVNNKNILQSIEQLNLSLIATFCHVFPLLLVSMLPQLMLSFKARVDIYFSSTKNSQKVTVYF